jgi:hypothetical protein
VKNNGRLAAQLACVGALVCVMLPLGQYVFPMVADTIGAFPFTAIEAVMSATLGLGLFEVLFG